MPLFKLNDTGLVASAYTLSDIRAVNMRDQQVAAQFCV